MNRTDYINLNRQRRTTTFDLATLHDDVRAEADCYTIGRKARSEVIRRATTALTAAKGVGADAQTLDFWWTGFEATLVASESRGIGCRINSALARTLITSRLVTPSWDLLAGIPLDPWVSTLPDDDPLCVNAETLRQALASITWASPKGRKRGVCCGTRVLLLHDYDDLNYVTDADLRALPLKTAGIDLLDAGLCQLNILTRSAQRGAARRHTAPPRTIHQLAESVPERFRPVTIDYLTAYRDRVSSKHATTQTKVRSLAY